jgi:hypothetical protein
MLDLLLKLIDRLIDLSKRKEEMNRSLFNGFVQPAFQAFEVVHADYIDSLTHYRARLADTSIPLDLNHPVFSDLELDSIKSEHFRTKLKDFRPEDSHPRLKEFLSSVQFYLQGLSASPQHIDQLDRLSRGLRLNSDDVETLLAEKDPDKRFKKLGGKTPRPPVLYSDPMREAIRTILSQIDARELANEEEDRRYLTEGLCWNLPFFGPDEDDRRRDCLRVVNITMQCFQEGYSVVSAAYSKLRSELLSPL